MQDPPASDQLLDAIATFLGREVLGAVADPALQFRVRIAAHLCGGLARELRAGPEADRAHLDALMALLEGGVPGGEDVPASIRAAERALAHHLREAPLDGEAYQRLAAALLAVAGQKIAVANPRFDLSEGFDRIE